MKILLIVASFLVAHPCGFAQTPSPEAISAKAIQLIGTQEEQQAAVPDLILIGIPAVPYIATYLADKDSSVKNAAWSVVNGIGFDAVVSFYIAQLSSSDASMRLQATRVLSSATNKYFGYTADNADTIKRAAIVDKWTAWLADYRTVHTQ